VDAVAVKVAAGSVVVLCGAAVGVAGEAIDRLADRNRGAGELKDRATEAESLRVPVGSRER
jgi:hypothetical protein